MKKLSCKIRNATLLDAKSIANIHVSSWQAAYKQLFPEKFLNSLSTTERMGLWEELISNGVVVLVLEIDSDVVGFASVCHYRSSGALPSDGEISAIYLHPSYWRMGLGKELCKEALRSLSNEHFTDVFVWVLEENANARDFYVSQGFEKTTICKTEKLESSIVVTEILYKKKI